MIAQELFDCVGFRPSWTLARGVVVVVIVSELSGQDLTNQRFEAL